MVRQDAVFSVMEIKDPKCFHLNRIEISSQRLSHHRATGNQLQKRGSETLKMCDKELGRPLPVISGHKIA